jgi:hypothetical protein
MNKEDILTGSTSTGDHGENLMGPSKQKDKFMARNMTI